MNFVPVFAALAFLAVAAWPAAAQPTNPPHHAALRADPQPLSDADKQFLAFAAEDNQAEIQLCLLAEKRAVDPALKAFARLMVNDHVAIESRLAALANDVQAQLPDGVGDEGERTRAELKGLAGDQFDRKFLAAQIEDHSKDIEKFSQAADRGSEGASRFASETLPILRQHLALARAVQTQLKAAE